MHLSYSLSPTATIVRSPNAAVWPGEGLNGVITIRVARSWSTACHLRLITSRWLRAIRWRSSGVVPGVSGREGLGFCWCCGFRSAEKWNSSLEIEMNPSREEKGSVAWTLLEGAEIRSAAPRKRKDSWTDEDGKALKATLVSFLAVREEERVSSSKETGWPGSPKDGVGEDEDSDGE